MENQLNPNISDISIDTHFNFSLSGWPASATLISLFLSGVIVYGINVWSKNTSAKSQLS